VTQANEQTAPYVVVFITLTAEPVRSVVDFEALLNQYKFVAGMDAVAGLDSHPDLLAMTPTEFEHLVHQLLEATGIKSWVTQAFKDDGVDVVAINEDPLMGGHCIIQAKRYRSAVCAEPRVDRSHGRQARHHGHHGDHVRGNERAATIPPTGTAAFGSSSAKRSSTSARST
jgi:hypothetical protein